MMTASSIAATSARGYARYLESKTVPPERGDYYLGREGAPAEAPGKWHVSREVLEALGIDPDGEVDAEDFVALMEGRTPPGAADKAPVLEFGDEGDTAGGDDGGISEPFEGAPNGSTPSAVGEGEGSAPALEPPPVVQVDSEWLRPAGKDGTRAAGVDVTFSAPKSVSIVWGLAGAAQRRAIEEAHGRAVAAALRYMRETVPLTVRWDPVEKRSVPALARELLAAEFRHTTARGVGGGPPDPQLHSHVVITSVVGAEGRVRAVRSRPVFRAAREVGAYYRAALAAELAAAGYTIRAGTGKHARYFEVAGIPDEAIVAFSKRTVEVRRAIAEFRSRYGRAPERGELRDTKLLSRERKTPETIAELEQIWERTAGEVGLSRGDVAALPAGPRAPEAVVDVAGQWGARVARSLTDEQPLFTDKDLRMVALEQAPGLLGPDAALEQVASLREQGEVLPVADGRLTTRRVREMELQVQRWLVDAAEDRTVAVSGAHRDAAIAATEERIGGALSGEQRAAVERITGPGRAAMLVGEAGTGKGVVIDAAARAELAAGREVLGTAVSGSTAERLGQDSPALAGRSIHVDALLAQVAHGHVDIDERTTILFDEAGMADTERLAALTRLAARRRAKLVLIGDAAQLPAIGAGGMFEELEDALPTARVTEVRRTRDRAEQTAWRALRRGDAGKAMAHYLARGQLHMSDVREDALEAAVRRYDELARAVGYRQVALMTDGTNLEIDAMNARAQQLRLQRGEVSEVSVPLPLDDTERPVYDLRAGDRVTWRRPQRVPGERRVENGTRGTIVAVDPAAQAVRVEIDGTGRHVDVVGQELAQLRLAYAQHLYRQQGATVDRAVTLTGGWQTSREGSYVQASRARHGIDWFVARADLGTEGDDAERIERLADAMRVSSAQRASISVPLQAGFDVDLDVDALVAELDVKRIRSPLSRDGDRGPAPTITVGEE